VGERRGGRQRPQRRCNARWSKKKGGNSYLGSAKKKGKNGLDGEGREGFRAKHRNIEKRKVADLSRGEEKKRGNLVCRAVDSKKSEGSKRGGVIEEGVVLEMCGTSEFLK